MEVFFTLVLIAGACFVGIYIKGEAKRSAQRDKLAQERANLLAAQDNFSFKTLGSDCLDWYSYFMPDTLVDETVTTDEGTCFLVRLLPQGVMECYRQRAFHSDYNAPHLIYKKSFTHQFVEGDRIEVQNTSFDKKRIKEVSIGQTKAGFSNYDRVVESGGDINLVQSDGMIVPIFPVHSRDQVTIANLATRLRKAVELSKTVRVGSEIGHVPSGLSSELNRDGFDL